jgi:hypothetical protein
VTALVDQGAFTRRCDAILASLPISWPFDVTAFLRELSTVRRRPIVLMRANLTPTGPSGLLVRTALADYIVIVRRTSGTHAQHILFHELGHLFLHPDHSGCADVGNVADRDEAEAEQFAHHFAAVLQRQRHAHRHSRARAQLRSAFGSRRQLHAVYG